MDIMDEVHCHIWVHCLLTTKDESPIILPHLKDGMLQIIEDEFSKMDCSVRIVNTSATHLNCLFKMNPELSLQETIETIKEVSAEFIHSNTESEKELVWDEDFSSLTVDAKSTEEVFTFIRDQEIRQLQNPDKSELDHLLELHGVSIE